MDVSSIATSHQLNKSTLVVYKKNNNKKNKKNKQITLISIEREWIGFPNLPSKKMKGGRAITSNYMYL
jgi:hypothetical protein